MGAGINIHGGFRCDRCGDGPSGGVVMVTGGDFGDRTGGWVWRRIKYETTKKRLSLIDVSVLALIWLMWTHPPTWLWL